MTNICEICLNVWCVWWRVWWCVGGVSGVSVRVVCWKFLGCYQVCLVEVCTFLIPHKTFCKIVIFRTYYVISLSHTGSCVIFEIFNTILIFLVHSRISNHPPSHHPCTSSIKSRLVEKSNSSCVFFSGNLQIQIFAGMAAKIRNTWKSCLFVCEFSRENGCARIWKHLSTVVEKLQVCIYITCEWQFCLVEIRENSVF